MTWENNMWKRMKKMQGQIDSTFGNIWNTSGRYFRKAWTDFDENENEFILNVELPGIEKEDIILGVKDRVLEIRAQKKREKKKIDEMKGFYGFSRDYVGFARSVSLPEEADVENVDAVFKNGVLTIKIAKKKSLVKSKRIKIR